LLLLTLSIAVFPAQAATQVEIDAAIAAGITWLLDQQNDVTGSWGTSLSVGYTGFAVLKLETHALQTGQDPLDPAYEHYSNVTAGLDYLFSMANTIPIVVQSAGDPDTNGNDLGVVIESGSGERMYETGVAMMAIAASTHPEMVVDVPGSDVDGWTYFDVLQDMVEFAAFAQNDIGAGPYRGGWRYFENWATSDNSITGIVILGLAYAEASTIEGVPAFSSGTTDGET
jgi:hypothetical protein